LIVLACDLASGCSAQREREATLRQNLVTMRQAIDNYTLGKKRVPQSLQDLVNEHYLKEIPTDPFTRKKDWVAELADTVLSADQTMTGIADVHSNSTQVGSNGIAYKDW
jgi:general secretion pathway protein G